MNTSSPDLLTILCPVKPKGPEDCGATTWDAVKTALWKEQDRPFMERLRPCVPLNGWVTYRECALCRAQKPVFRLRLDGKQVDCPRIAVQSRKAGRVSVVNPATGEVVEVRV